MNVAASAVVAAGAVAAVVVIAVVAAGVAATAAIAVVTVAVATVVIAAAAVTVANNRDSTRCFSKAGHLSGLFCLGVLQPGAAATSLQGFLKATAGSPWLHRSPILPGQKPFFPLRTG